MEANLRFPGPETMETKIFARLSAWQNWIFQRPNAVGPKGALQVYGTGERSDFEPARSTFDGGCDSSRGNSVRLSEMNAGALPMANGLSRLATHFLGEPEKLEAALAHDGPFGAAEALEAGLVTFAPDDIDWEDEVRLAVEERASLSPDALTGMEASLRFGGPETMLTRVFGRLTAWQNWIFVRPNAVGEQGALKVYGTGAKPKFNWERV